MKLDMVVYTFNPSTRGRGKWICEFESGLVYKVSSKSVKATRRNPAAQ